MKLLQIVDFLREQTLRISVPDETEDLRRGQQIFIKNKKQEKLIATIVWPPRTVPNAVLDLEHAFVGVVNSKDTVTLDKLQEGEMERVIVARDLAEKHQLNMHFFASRVGWQSRQTSFFFVSPNPVDFRSLLKDLVQKYRGRIQIERVSARSRARMIDPFAVFGKWGDPGLHDHHERVPMEVVREQNIGIKNNQKIFDVSGKIKLSMLYEVAYYRQMQRYLPRLQQRVTVDGEPGLVAGLDVLNKQVRLEMGHNHLEIFPVEKIEYPHKQIESEHKTDYQPAPLDPDQVGV